MINVQISDNRITSNSVEAFSLYERSRFGEKKENHIEYSPIEALFLLSEKRISLFAGKKAVSRENLIKKLRKSDKRIETKLSAYRDLRRKGYILKTALKFGADFRVYQKGVKPGEDHARWVLFVVRESESLNWHDFAAKNRIAHSTKKNLLIAIVDEEGDLSYYEVSWQKP